MKRSPRLRREFFHVARVDVSRSFADELYPFTDAGLPSISVYPERFSALNRFRPPLDVRRRALLVKTNEPLSRDPYVRGRVEAPALQRQAKPAVQRLSSGSMVGEMDGDLRVVNDAIVLLEDTDAVHRGESVIARLQPIDPDRWAVIGPGAESS